MLAVVLTGSAHMRQAMTEAKLSRKLDLSCNQLGLLEVLQKIRYGRIERLLVRDGEPDLSGIRWRRTVKLGGENGPHPCTDTRDFALRREVIDFFRGLRELGDAELTDIEIRNGIPFKFDVCGSGTD
jgi:hypothetical protein